MRDLLGRYIIGHGPSNTGRTRFKKGMKISDETRKRMSLASIKSGTEPPHYVGEQHPNWKGGISSLKNYSRFYKNQYKHRKRGAIGNHTKEDWFLLKAKYQYMCVCCKRQEPEIEITEDHIIPISKGGSNNIDNIQPLCRSCNGRKINKIINYLILND